MLSFGSVQELTYCHEKRDCRQRRHRRDVCAAIREDGRLVELFLERDSHQLVVETFRRPRGNVLPGMQAAFVNIGLERNAFLYVDDAQPGRAPLEGETPLPRSGRRPTIGELVRTGQDILVQVAKEPIGTKGARVTRNITLPGRFLVLMPHVDYVGVSRRITDERERDRLKQIAHAVKPDGMGLIVRTVAEGASEEELAHDAAFLERHWQQIASPGQDGQGAVPGPPRPGAHPPAGAGRAG